MEPRRVGTTARWARALVLSAVILTAGAVAHRSGGGSLPGAVELVTLFLGGVLGCAALLGVQRATCCLVTTTVGGQVAVHTLLGVLSGHGARGGHGGHGGHLTDAATLVDSPGMALAHLLAAAAVGWWLASGERALWSLLALVGRRGPALLAAARLVLFGVLAALPSRARLRAVPVRDHDRIPQRPVWSRELLDRGPPVLLLTR